MKALLNIITITISQCDSKDLTKIWLDRLERYVKYLLIVSEVWKTKNEQYFGQV